MTVTYPIITLLDGEEADPQWFSDITEAINDHQSRLSIVEVIDAPSGVSNAGTTSGTDTTTSASYVNMAGTGAVTSFSLTKVSASTRVKLSISIVWFATTATTLGQFALQLNGTDYTCSQANLPSGAVLCTSGWTYASGVPAGTYTVQARWRRPSAGQLNRGVNEWLSIEAIEVV